MSKTKTPTLADIAGRLGLSQATVSTALTGRRNGTFVSDATQRQVRAMASEVGYPLSRLRARKPVLKRMAVVCAPYPVYHVAVLKIFECLSRERFQMLVHTTGDHAEACAIAQQLHRRREIDGAIFVGTRNRPEEVPEGGFPFVIVGDVPDGVAAWHVTQDNEGGGRLVGEHLWSLGHRRVGMLMFEHGTASQKRCRGLHAAWNAHGRHIPDDHLLMLPDENHVADRLPDFLQVHSRRDEPLTALVTTGDQVAWRTLNCLWQMGIRVPDQISVTGFDNVGASAASIPPLTTVGYPVEAFGTRAVDLLLSQMRDPTQPPRTSVVDVELVARESTAPPPGVP